MSIIAVESQPSPPSVAPFPQPGMKGGGSGEGSLDFRALLSSLCPDPAAECQSWPCADPQWEGWFKNDWRGWPEWVTGFRDHQLHAIVEIVDAYARGADVVFLDAPTGAGKTLVAEAVRRLVSKASVYVCHSLGLQEQMVTDFPSSSDSSTSAFGAAAFLAGAFLAGAFFGSSPSSTPWNSVGRRRV